MAELEEKVPRRLVLVCGMLNTKDASGFLAAFKGLAEQVVTIAVPGEAATIAAEDLALIAREAGLEALEAPDLRTALALTRDDWRGPARVLICGSLYLAGHVLAEHG
jgi:dihydrofolate synthase/folylpolyglutamate synthase